MILKGGDLQLEVGHIQDAVLLLLALVRNQDGHLRYLDVNKQFISLGSLLHLLGIVLE